MNIIVRQIYLYIYMSVYRTVGPLVSYFFQIMNECDQTFNPNVHTGHYDLISWFSDFALYLNTQWVYDHILSHYE